MDQADNEGIDEEENEDQVDEAAPEDEHD